MDAGQFDAKRYDNPEWTPPKCVIVWANNPVPTCPDAFHGHWVVECMKRGAKVITVDTRTTWMASRSEIHLQIRPGTDGALALAMAHVIINEKLYDKEFVEKWTYGFKELKERVQEFTPDRVSSITWAPKEAIVQGGPALCEQQTRGHSLGASH